MTATEGQEKRVIDRLTKILRLRNKTTWHIFYSTFNFCTAHPYMYMDAFLIYFSAVFS